MFAKAMKRIVPLAIVLAAVLVAWAMVASRAELTPLDAAQPLPHVQAIEVTLSDVPIAIVAHGTVRSRQELDLASEVAGRIVWVAPAFESGGIVTAGTPLLRMDPVSYQLALAQAKAALATAEIALADATALKRQAAIGEGKLNIEAARQRIAKAEQDLAYTEIRAPFDAVIDRKLVEYGQYIGVGSPVARLLGTALAEVMLPVTPAEAGFLAPVTGADVELSAMIGEHEQQWQGRLARVESRVDQATRVVPVVVEVAAPYDVDRHGQALPLGLFVSASLPGRPVSAGVRLPSSALHADETVFVLRDNALQRRKVHVAHREGNTVVINEGLQSGDLVVTTRLDFMFEGMKVELGGA